MKFTIASVVLALALAVSIDASVIPWASEIAGHGLSYTAVSGPAHAVAVHAVPSVWGHAHGPIVTVDAWGHDDGQWHGDAWHGHAHAPALVVAAPHVHAPAVVVAAAHAHEGAYVAKTRGAVHTAPLSGHANSVASINVEPAPGTV